jgi:hypothetical protein
MNLDIHGAVVMVVIVTILGAIISIWAGIRAIRKGIKVAYYRLKRKQTAGGWRAIIFALILIGISFLVGRYGEPVTYSVFKPSPSRTPTSTISMTPTISLTPTISFTPTISPTLATSYTPTSTGTPFLPMGIETQFKSMITPNPGAIFSPLIFSLSVKNFLPIDPQTVFQNPLSRVYVTYSYDGMTDGIQWTEVWYRNGQMINDHYKTGAWDSGTGGFGQDDLTLPAEQWLPGTYQLVIFVGIEWKVLGEFRVMGTPPTPTTSHTPSITRTPSMTSSLTRSPLPSRTPRPTDTRWPSPTPTR